MGKKQDRIKQEWEAAAQRLGISATGRFRLEGKISEIKVAVWVDSSQTRSWTHYRVMHPGIRRVRWDVGQRDWRNLRIRKYSPVDDNETVFVHPEDIPRLRPEQVAALVDSLRISVVPVRVGEGRIDMITDRSTADVVEKNVLALVSIAQALAH